MELKLIGGCDFFRWRGRGVDTFVFGVDTFPFSFFTTERNKSHPLGLLAVSLELPRRLRGFIGTLVGSVMISTLCCDRVYFRSSLKI